MNSGSLFSGYLGLDLAVEQVFGAETAWTSDIDEGARKIIAHRTTAPNLGDITKINWAQVEPVSILAAGWPCQPFSLAGKRKGAADERALWPYVGDAVRILRPRYVVLENVSAIATAGELARATASLAALGYVGSWLRLRASDVGAPHGRARIFIVATDAEHDGSDGPALGRGFATGEASGRVLESERRDPATTQDADSTTGGQRRVAAPGQAETGRPRADAGRRGGTSAVVLPTPRATRGGSGTETWVTGVPGLKRNQQLEALGNGVVPQQASAALRWMLTQEGAA
jgi:DNA (cytosine-5)-methyltransferase 1